MKIFGVQLDMQWEDKAANFARVRELVTRAAPPPGALVALPEMFATGFSMNAQAIAENHGGETEQFLAALALEHQIFVIAGIVAPSGDGRGRNEAVVFSPDGNPESRPLARYCKIHPFSFGGEDRHYAAGEGIALFAWQGFRVAPFICYDLRFPEIFRAAAKRDANLFVVIANWPQVREAHWLALLRARAIENQAYVLGVNRCGSDPKLHYAGRSQIIDPRGELLADAGNDESVISAELDLNDLETYRREFSALADMRF